MNQHGLFRIIGWQLGVYELQLKIVSTPTEENLPKLSTACLATMF